MSGLTLVIMAAGMASRYGSLKQLDGFGPNGEAIIDYSLYDAIRAGFTRVVFVIRPELEGQFRERFDAKLAGKIEVRYAFQTVDRFVPEGTDIGDRVKPWGTGHAVLCARDEVDGPFAVINADDFCGYDAFFRMAKFLSDRTEAAGMATIAYPLSATLSDFWSVSRGVIVKDGNDHLLFITEHTDVIRSSDGKILTRYGNDEPGELDKDALVSVNFFGFSHSVFDEIQSLFEGYLAKFSTAPKAEFYIPSVVTSIISRNYQICKVYSTSAEWFGVTNPQDKPKVQHAIQRLVSAGEYPEKLFA